LSEVLSFELKVLFSTILQGNIMQFLAVVLSHEDGYKLVSFANITKFTNFCHFLSGGYGGLGNNADFGHIGAG
jgi:hypothetical protein